MKILFVENRYKTTLWELIAEKYIKLGHEIFWIVQNPMFKPSKGTIHILPFPKKVNWTKVYTPAINKIIRADRGINYFGIKSDNFIFWYQKEIEKIIEEIQPNLVFGESTLFHELLTIDSCKKRNILYLHPSSSRYPVNRFSFYQYDTLIPFEFSDDTYTREQSLKVIESIAKRTKLPDYMSVIKHSLSRKDWLLDKLKLSIGYYRGEKYNTPSPFKKRRVTKMYSLNIDNWEKSALDISHIKNDFNILYAMQMQPEANIDVWGYPNNNQAEVVEWIASQLKDGEKLIVKPNPKSKYEISDKLLQVIKKHQDKIIPLKHTTKMDELWHHIDLVVTVTGTISIECIFDNKPIVMLGQGLQTKEKNCTVLNTNDSLIPTITLVKEKNYPTLTEQEKIDYLNHLMNTSFAGINGDGLHNIHYLEEANLEELKAAYTRILDELR
jgi:hypothetical protein